jgi:hypothetical protein
MVLADRAYDADWRRAMVNEKGLGPISQQNLTANQTSASHLGSTKSAI